MKSKQLILLLIILIGFGLRLSVSYTHSYTNDELSAIKRLNFNTFDDLITYGVQVGDMHPAGTQLFMKAWSFFVGTSSFLMRLPFVLLGTAAIWLVFLIGKLFSEKTGLLAAGIWSFLLFPILQSELARPYSPGLFFTLLSGLFLFRILFIEKVEKKRLIIAIYAGLSMTAAMYTHYFAFLTVAFMGASSLLFMKKSNFKFLLLAGGIAVLLFIPHLNITLYQTSIEGGIQWLAKPNAIWLFEFIFFAFNQSIFLIISLLLLFIFGFFKPNSVDLKKQSLLLIWFFGIFVVGFILSYIQTPILKFPVMLFPFPFLVIIIAYYLQKIDLKLNYTFPIIISALVLTSTIVEQNPWSKYHFEVFEELHSKATVWRKDIAPNNLAIAMNVNDPFYINFFAKNASDSLNFILDELNYEDELKWKETLDTLQTEYLIFAYSARTTPAYFFSIANHYFPFIKAYQKFNNSGIYLLSKNSTDQNIKLTSKTIADFPTDTKNWQFNAKSLVNQQYTLDSDEIYQPQIQLTVTEEMASNKEYINFSLSTISIDSFAQFTLVITPENKFNKPIKDANGQAIWIGLNLEKALLENNKAYFSINCPPQVKQNDQLKVYIWNRNKSSMVLDTFKIETIENIWN